MIRTAILTAVAALALADTAASGFQAALMAPTEILARQHHQRLSPMLEAAGASNIFDDLERNWPRGNWEDVITRDPEWIVVID